MKRRMFSVHDSCSGVFGPIMICITNEEAVRNFAYACKNNETIRDHPEHFTLFFLGIFDDSSGKIEAEDKVSLVNGVEMSVDNVKQLSAGGTA